MHPHTYSNNEAAKLLEWNPRTVRRLESIADAADYVGVSTKTIRRWISAGIVTGYRAGPRLIKVDLNDLDAMLRPIPTASSSQVFDASGSQVFDVVDVKPTTAPTGSTTRTGSPSRFPSDPTSPTTRCGGGPNAAA